MARIAPVLALSLAILGLICGSAQAAPRVDSIVSPEFGQTDFTFECAGDQCRAVLRVYDGPTRLTLKELEWGEGDGVSAVDPLVDVSATYKWSCKRTGRLRWTVTVSGYEDATESGDDNNPDRSGNGVAKGSFTVGRCEKSTPRRVRRGYVAASAAAEYEDEFVSRSVCSPLARVKSGKASKWRCLVVHNNTYRECSTAFRMSYTQRLTFGVRKYKEHVKRLRTDCRSY